ELRDAWLELAGEAGGSFWNRYIPSADPLPFEEVFRLAGVPFIERATPIFELGFTLDKTDFEKNARITQVRPDSAAPKAGLQTGDSLQRFSVYYGDASKPVKFGLLRNGELVSVEYMPVTTRNVVQVGTKLEVLRSGVQ